LTASEPVSIERLKALDEVAFRALVRRHHGTLVRLARTIVGSSAAAEDVAQETWLAAIRSIDRFEGRSSVVGWLASIAINKAHTRAERDGRFVALADEADRDAGESQAAIDPRRFRADGHWSEPPAVWDTLDPERIFSGCELWRHVSAALATLPPAQQAVVTLRDIEDCDAVEVCRILKITRENQRVLLHRARAHLRTAIERLLKDDAATASAGHATPPDTVTRKVRSAP
jgi:RNA polymerase sigma-70 factor (ECF subfamily)